MSQTSTFVKQLASNQRPVREKALDSLKKYLLSKNSSNLSLSEAEKLWKGLYFSMWFCDRPKTQERLAEDLGSLFSQQIPFTQFNTFVNSFWNIMIREWPNIDQWRIDKYYLLIRRVVRHNFKYLVNHDFDLDLVSSYLSVLTSTVLSGDKSVPNALPYHICDIFLDELQLIIFSSLESQQESLDNELDHESNDYQTLLNELNNSKKEIVAKIPINQLITPFIELNKSAPLKTLRQKCDEEVLSDQRLKDWGVQTKEDSESEGESDSDVEDEDEEEWKGL